MINSNEISQAVKDGVEAGEAIVNDVYDMIEKWKKKGISEYNISRVLVFLFPEIIMSSSPDKETAHNLLQLAINKIGEAINDDTESDGETIH